LITEAAIAIRGLHHSYGAESQRNCVLRSVDLDVWGGEVVVLAGASGAGKTTLLTLCGALRSVQAGRVRVLGRDLGGLDEGTRRDVRAVIGFVFQSHNLLDALTAGQNVVLSLLGRVPVVEACRQAEAALGLLGLASRIDAFPDALSGGEKQRVAVARALVRQPALILADEPTASLDDEAATAVVQALRRAAKEAGAAVLIATHDPRVLEIADRTLHLKDGLLNEPQPRRAFRPRVLHAGAR
jgi:putative ABC transport system ATP-binding protein